jgi:hypothetical protein
MGNRKLTFPLFILHSEAIRSEPSRRKKWDMFDELAIQLIKEIGDGLQSIEEAIELAKMVSELHEYMLNLNASKF